MKTVFILSVILPLLFTIPSTAKKLKKPKHKIVRFVNAADPKKAGWKRPGGKGEVDRHEKNQTPDPEIIDFSNPSGY